MTFAAAYTALLALAAELGHTGCVRLDVEVSRYYDGAAPVVGWCVWCADRGRHYFGDTAEDVLDAYRTDAPHFGGMVADATPAALDAIGACEVAS